MGKIEVFCQQLLSMFGQVHHLFILSLMLAAPLGLFMLTHNSLVGCLALLVPILFLAWITSWWCGMLSGCAAAVIVAPYSGKLSIVSPPLEPTIWVYLGVCYAVLGLLVGLQGTATRRQQATYLEANEKLRNAEANTERYKTLLRKQSEGHKNLSIKNEELALLNTIANTVNCSLDFYQVQTAALGNIGLMMDVDEIQLFWLNSDEGSLILKTSQPLLEDIDSIPPVPVDENIMGRVISSRHVEMISDETEMKLRPSTIGRNIKCIIAVPLFSQGRVSGVMVLGRKSGQRFSVDEGKVLESIGKVLAIAMENTCRYREVKDLSLTDELTGIPNRRMLNLRLSGEMARVSTSGDPLCLTILDLDQFKNINDRFGHPAGDEVLCQFARRVQREIRGSDIFCRLGGDEFALIAVNTPLHISLAIVERICRNIAHTPFELADGIEVPVTVSIGLAYRQYGISTGDELVAAADRALYSAKTAGRNRVMVFSPDLLAQAAS